ncbi:MAG: hypothetical protein PF572_06675 [Patescibacteria group bacterium]|jgi:flagellar basal body-associated protein FliL|nr:hypothetical protein [Patescibacteria group bacterium]
MIIQKANKKKMYINIVVLVVVFGLIAYLLISNFGSFGSSEEENPLATDAGGPVPVVIKYSNLKKISLDIFEDKRYKDLVEMPEGFRPNFKKGNSNPFSAE